MIKCVTNQTYTNAVSNEQPCQVSFIKHIQIHSPSKYCQVHQYRVSVHHQCIYLKLVMFYVLGLVWFGLVETMTHGILPVQKLIIGRSHHPFLYSSRPQVTGVPMRNFHNLWNPTSVLLTQKKKGVMATEKDRLPAALLETGKLRCKQLSGNKEITLRS